MSSAEAVKKWRRETKKRMIDSMGGECQLCGYNKCQEALELHHINPDEKELSFGAIRANPKAWLKSLNSKSLWSFSSLTIHPGRLFNCSEICSDDNLIIIFLVYYYIKS